MISEQEQELAGNIFMFLKASIDGLLATIVHLRSENQNIQRENLSLSIANSELQKEYDLYKHQLIQFMQFQQNMTLDTSQHQDLQQQELQLQIQQQQLQQQQHLQQLQQLHEQLQQQQQQQLPQHIVHEQHIHDQQQQQQLHDQLQQLQQQQLHDQLHLQQQQLLFHNNSTQ